MTGFQLADTLRRHRSLLLALEAIGWLHMTGKAKSDFLRQQGGEKGHYEYEKWDELENPHFPWDDRLNWVKERFTLNENAWPCRLSEFILRHRNKEGKGLLGLLQAGHAMASGIEKNLPRDTSKYLAQDVTHIWLSTAFGHPVCNLLHEPPELLTNDGWKRLLHKIEELLKTLKELGEEDRPNEIRAWWELREEAVGPEGWLRKAFTSTLAETRLPNNDVTLFDQSYVAAALFKSAAAGAILEGDSFPWSSKELKQQTRWRLLTVGIGADHYESRAIKIGDWTGARLALDEFFIKVRKLVEIDLAVGSLLYRDSAACVFSFPGERFSHDERDYQGGNLLIAQWQSWLTEQIDDYAREADLEIPPYCQISEPSRSLICMTKEIKKAREEMAVPLHRDWGIPAQSSSDGHVCPVCLVRRGTSKTDKQALCQPCQERRSGRLGKWLEGKSGSDSIWISEVADANDRVALVTMSLDIEPWLDGTRLDSLRTQAILEWRKFNPSLEGRPNPIDPASPFSSLLHYIREKLGSFDKNDPVLKGLQDGYNRENNWSSFFSKIVEDRADAPKWGECNDDERAAWLTHQLFRKLASPGRTYRFWRQAEEFFGELLVEFREIAAKNENLWRVRRLVIKPKNIDSSVWEDKQTYEGRHGDAPVELLYREETDDFLTICNLARLLKREEGKESLLGAELELKASDSAQVIRLEVASAELRPGALGVYHPVIPLELSPVRFRVLLPLEDASNCVDRAIEKWKEQFARVWDRLPLRVGVVAFPRMTPFQAVIEAARNIEDDLTTDSESEVWQVVGHETLEDIATLTLKSIDRPGKFLQTTIPIKLPDGRDDVFYPYIAVEDRDVRHVLDFQRPKNRDSRDQVYRHARDLRHGERVFISPALIATVFLDTTARRFELFKVRLLTEWRQMRELWQLIERKGPSQTALRGAWSELVERREAWQGLDGTWLEGGKAAWLDLARAIFYKRLGFQGACLKTLVQAASDELLDWCLEWHLTILKKQISGGRS